MSTKLSENWSDEQIEITYPECEKHRLSDRYRYGDTSEFACSKRNMGKKWQYRGFGYCRDSFQSDSVGTTKFLYNVESEEYALKIATFINQIESHLGLKSKSIFGMTSNSNKSVMWIRVARWWIVQPHRKSFFTGAIRIGWHFNPNKSLYDNLTDREARYYYFRETSYAVEKFLLGYTKLHKDVIASLEPQDGWHDIFFTGIGRPSWAVPFVRMSKDYIDQILLK